MRILLLFFLSFSVFAIQCPNGQPPQTTPSYIQYSQTSGSYTGFGLSWAEACSDLSAKHPTYDFKLTDNGIFCQISTVTGSCPSGCASNTQSNKCIAGYNWTGSQCILNNPSLVQCDPTCTAGQSIGFGSTDGTESQVCADGCKIRQRGLSAHELDVSGNKIGTKLAEFEQTGESCTPDLIHINPPDPPPDPSKPNCITNGSRQLCISTEKPGCGTVNGKEWCPDMVGCGTVNGQRVCVPDDGGCTPSGGLDFACTKNATPPPAPNNEPPPVVDFKAEVPVQNAPAPAGGTPSTGAIPNTPGSDTGGRVPVTIGHYPGNSGNGTIDNPTQNNPGSNGSEGRNGSGSGTGNIDTSGLAQESSLQSLGGLVTQIRDSLRGSLSGSGFTASNPGAHSNVNLSPEVTAKQSELTTKLNQVKAEFTQLLSFGSSSNAQALQCPANSGFTFYGTTISLCTQSVLSATATIGNVLIFLAFVVSLFILLS